MLFNSLLFLFFFCTTYGVYLLLQRAPLRWQNGMLLVASYIFYGAWNWRFLALIGATTLIDFLLANRLAVETREHQRRAYLLTSLVANLSILGFFKYFGFFSESAVALLRACGLSVDEITLNIILPVGISFYTFQSLSYTIDVFRRRIQPVSNVLDYALYLAFFPQLVAGPIERASHLLPQFQQRRKITPQNVNIGIYLIVWGLFEKMVVADNLGIVVNAIFASPGKYSGLDLVLGSTAFALQIFGDFSGYSSIARGLAFLMGFDLMVNFRLPYFARNPADFWHRWHISLSSWLRDYVYIPMGGNRHGTLATYRNLIATMLLGGLWHGAAWNFVAWGAYHGVGLAIHRLVQHSTFLRGSTEPDTLPGRGWREAIITSISITLMFAFTVVGWTIFRATSLDQAIEIISRFSWRASEASGLILQSILFYSWPLLLLQVFQAKTGNLLVVTTLPVFWRCLFYAVIIALIAVIGVREPTEFIYFQF